MRIKKNIAISDSGFVFNPTTGDSYSMNRIGRQILDYLREGNTLEEIKPRMTEEYDVDEASFEKYYFDFLSMLRQFELLDEKNED